jgi:RNA polymerase sigma factor (sigma-70 family)
LDNEKILIDKAKAGDSDSFEKLILNSKNKAYNLAFRYLNNQEDAMDAVQESYIKVFKGLNAFQGNSSFDTWVYRIVVNTCNDFARKNSKNNDNYSIYYEDGEQIKELSQIVDMDSQPEQVLMKTEMKTYIMDCLERLPNDQKEAVILRDIQNFSYEEIGKMLNCSEGTIKSRIHRGRNTLRLLINKVELV